MGPSLQDMSPQEWLHYHRERQGYTSDKIAYGDLVKALECLPKRVRTILPMYSSFTRADLDDRQIEIVRTPLERVLKPEEKRHTDDVFILVFPTFDFDGYAGRTPKGDKVIMLHSGLFVTLVRMAQLEIYEHELAPLASESLTDEMLVSQLMSCAAPWLKNKANVWPYTPIPSLSEKGQEYSSVLAHAAMTFVLGHECGHIIEGHYAYDFHDKQANYDMEFGADQWGLRLCLRHIVFNGPDIGDVSHSRHMLLGPFLAVGIISMLSSEGSRTHPVPAERFRRVHAGLPVMTQEILGTQGFAAFGDSMGQDFLEGTVSLGEKLFLKLQTYGRIIARIDRSVRTRTGVDEDLRRALMVAEG